MVRESRKKRVRKQKREAGVRKSQERRAEKSTGHGEALGPGQTVAPAGPVPPQAGEELRAARDRPPPALRIWAPLPVRRGGPRSSGLGQFLLPPPGRPQGGAGPWWGGPQGRAPVPDCLGALGQAFQLAGPDLSGGLSSREINRGGGLQ